MREPSLSDLLEQAREENRKLLGFIGEIMDLHRGDGCEPGGVDGGTIQDAAIKFGLLEERTVTGPCCACCACADVGFPTTCYFPSELLKRAATHPNP